MQIIILADNTYSDVDNVFLRGTGAHKIATWLRNHGWQTEIVDYILRWPMHEFQELCKKIVGPDTLMLGVSSNLFTDRQSFNEKLLWFKKQHPTIPIVVGGNNLLSREMFPVDYMIEGYAESALLSLLDYLSGRVPKNSIKWSKFTNKVNLIDATTDYPYHDTRDLTIRYQPSDFIASHETLAIEIARGCIFKCKFCTYPLIGKSKNDFIRHHSTIRDELLYNYETYGIKNYIIAEDTFNDSNDKLQNLADAISHLPFQPQFASFMRFDLIWSRPQSLNLLKQIGLRAAYFGIETFNNQDAKLVRKGMPAEKIKDGLAWWVQEAKEIATQVGMIMGLPHANEEQAWKDNDWLAKSGINWWSWHALWFTDTTKTIHTSDFSYNFRDYGYELMTDQEIETAINKQNLNQDPSYKLFHYNTKSSRQKMAYWKHKGNKMDFFSAADLCNSLNAASQTRRLGGFHVFTHASLGYDINDVMNWGYYDVKPSVPEQDIKQKTQTLIAKYIKNKINFQYEKQHRTAETKLIPIVNANNLKTRIYS
jgi:hypothetical protein